jgi:hypothetical protein
MELYDFILGSVSNENSSMKLAAFVEDVIKFLQPEV